jgi:transcriptional regulator with XRE-family HTH domain
MTNTYFDFIKQNRIQRKISQLEMAQKLGISRTTYIELEQGKRCLSLDEGKKLANIFGISLESLEQGESPDYEKYKQMILAYLRNDNSVDGKVTKTKLAKLLYLADFAWFYKHLESMSGMQYRKNHYGPVPDMYFRALDELEESGQINIDRSKEGAILISENRGSARQKLEKINGKEIKLIKDISMKWKDKRTQEIVDFTHKQLPYMICDDNEIIPYGLITQEDPGYVY